MYTMAARFTRLGVVGAGQMGTGIALTAAKVAGLKVTLYDAAESQLKKSHKFAEDWSQKQVSKGTIKCVEDVLNLLSFELMNTHNAPASLNAADVFVEAVKESFEVKKQIFEKLDECANKKAILCTNTSSISITRIAGVTHRPQNVVGMHFMNPVPVMPLVELIPGLATTDQTLNSVQELAASMGKTCVKSLDRPGFVANRILMPYINEAIYVLQEGIATPEGIDQIMKLGTNVPMGPLKLADFIGLDTCLHIQRVLHEELGDSKYRPSPLLIQYVDAGWLGKKVGRGFYEY